MSLEQFTKPEIITSLVISFISTPKGIRTPVASVKGRCPRPLDDGGEAVQVERSPLSSTQQNYASALPSVKTALPHS